MQVRCSISCIGGIDVKEIFDLIEQSEGMHPEQLKQWIEELESKDVPINLPGEE